MRMRKKKNIDKRLDACKKYIVQRDEIIQKGISNIFLKKQMLFLEIGCGKGSFAVNMCRLNNKDFNYIAFEKVKEAAVVGMEKANLESLSDILFIVDDAGDIGNIFSKDEIDKIFINFCDPWHKKKHEKRRLTHENFLNQYKKILKEGGEICFKTDNQALFEFSIAEFSKCGFILKEISLDLHRSQYSHANIVTEYEQRFSNIGMPIYRLVAINKKNT